MSDYNLDNDGTGFVVDADLDELFDDAESASEDTKEGNTEAFFNENYTPGDELKTEEKEEKAAFEFDDDFTIVDENTDTTPQEATGATVVGEHHAVDELTEDTNTAPQNAVEESAEEKDIPTVDLEKQNTEEVKTITSNNNNSVQPQYYASDDHNEQKRPRVIMPNIEDSINNVNQIINILDAYRKLTDNEKNVAGQFITGGEVVSSESEFIVKVINVDRMLPITMKALGEAKHRDPVERAFYVIELDNDILYNLGSLVSVFMPEGQEPKPSNSNTQYAREVVRCIDALSSEDMRYIEATELVLRASERKTN